MKRRIFIAISCLIIVILCCLIDFSIYQRQSKTIQYEENGIILSITTFDGETETEPFVKSLGHTWLSVDNQSGHPIYIKDYEIKHNEILTLSVWAISGHRGVVFNLEPNFIKKYNRYVGRQSLSINIKESQLNVIENFIEKNDNWKLSQNCNWWSIFLWNELVDDEYKLNTQTLLYTTKRVQKALNEFDCIEVNKDFSRSNQTFFYHDVNRMELELCS